MSTPDASQVPRHLLELLQDRYEFLSVLGRGGSGTVFEVRNIQLGRLEALKVLTSSLTMETTKRFVQEARVSASLDHPGIVRVYDFGQLEGINWFSMQLIDGPSLSTMIDSGIRLNAVGFARLAMPLLEALAYSHEKGVIHRDIKPANIMLQKSGYPCLTDFGIAKAPDSADLTQTGNMMGTPAYMAPEQAEGKTVDSRTDQYSMAITLYRAISGRLPFSSAGPVETLVQRLKEDPEPLDWHCPDFPAPLRRVIMKALSRKKEDRHASASDMRRAMQEACEACEIQWDKPLEGFEYLSTSARMPIEATDYGLDAELTASGRHSKLFWRGADKTILYVVVGPLVIVAATASFLLFRKTQDKQRTSSAGIAQHTLETGENHVCESTTGVEDLLAPKRQHATKDSPVAVQTPAIPRHAITQPLNIESGVPESITIPPELQGKMIRVKLAIGENGKVKECTFLDKDLSADEKRIATAIAMHMVWSPGLDIEGKPVASSAVTVIPL